MKAWSQNLANNDVLTTFQAYGAVPFARQAEIIGSIGAAASRSDEAEAFEAFKAMHNDPRFAAIFGARRAQN